MSAPYIPSDVTLPGNAKYFSFKSEYVPYNPEFDITWSFTYSVSNTDNAQHGIATFLTSLSESPDNLIPGHYLCTKSSETSSTVSFLTGDDIFTRNPYNIITIAIDSTGYFALSSTLRPGTDTESISSNSLIVRAFNDELLYNEKLPDSFNIENSINTIRCRYSNANERLYIDYRDSSTTTFTRLAEVQTGYKIYNTGNTDYIYPGISFCSPLSTSDTSTAALLLYNFHIDGTANTTATEVLTSAILT